MRVTIDRDFLARVYDGPDPAGFAAFVGRAAGDPRYVVVAEQPATLGVLEIFRAPYEAGLTAWGHHLHGDWKLLKRALRHCDAHGIDSFFYPIMAGRPNTYELFDVLTRRYGFEPYHLVLKRSGHASRTNKFAS